jgi:hypothetical protein
VEIGNKGRGLVDGQEILQIHALRKQRQDKTVLFSPKNPQISLFLRA